jgi:hypothetical protein
MVGHSPAWLRSKNFLLSIPDERLKWVALILETLKRGRLAPHVSNDRGSQCVLVRQLLPCLNFQLCRGCSKIDLYNRAHDQVLGS